MRKAFTLIELLVVVAIIAILAAILFPVFARVKFAAKKSASAQNNRQIALANIMYGADYDDRICVMINGPWRDLKSIDDGVLTSYGEQRTDAWPLLLMPYIKSRGILVDPGRGDVNGVFSTVALGDPDPGPLTPPHKVASFRNQSLYPFYGVNYLFASPLVIPASRLSDPTPIDFMVGESHAFTDAQDPAKTIFYTESQRGYTPTSNSDPIGELDSTFGFFGVNAPGMWGHLAAHDGASPVIFWTGTNCSGDWCGDADALTSGQQRRSNFVYIGYNDGANASFLDGHVKYLSDSAMAAGTDYLSATPQDGGLGSFGGGCTIIDHTKNLWGLDQEEPDASTPSRP